MSAYNLIFCPTHRNGDKDLGFSKLGFPRFEFLIGGLAQLVERLLCKQNVNGSNPLISTNLFLTGL